MQPIETTYRDTRFRSRLEADYAATFDSIVLPWQYEPEGFKLSDGSWYSPDFYLPSARAWCEVKGDHQERVSKVERFAADLWEAAGQPHYEDPTAPMIILATPPKQEVIEIEGYPPEVMGPGYDTLNIIGVRGPGRRQSVGIVRCEHCNQVTIIGLWQRPCRACGHAVEDPMDWHESWVKYLHTRFVRLPRPAGRGKSKIIGKGK